MQNSARHLAMYGRHGDNNLVHVSDRELAGIERLTGRKFTRNPETGLPEAFNFNSLIPIAAGIAGTVLTGNPVLGAAAAGLASAGVAKSEGASTESALTKGLISGATSFAGGQLLSGVGSGLGETVGAAAGGGGEAASGIAAGATEAAGAGAGNLTAGGVGQAVSNMPDLGSAAPGAGLSVNNAAIGSAKAGGTHILPAQIYGAASNVGPAAPPPPTMMEGISNRASALGDRISNIASDPMGAAGQLGSNIQARPFPALIAGAGLVGTLSDMNAGSGQMPGTAPYDPNRFPEQFPSNPRRWNAPAAGYQPGQSAEFRYFAKGGLAQLRREDGLTENVMNEAKAALLGEHPRAAEALRRFRDTFGDSALNMLRDRMAGGRVRGAGGGMDDLVPGSIEGRQKVRLADGEFVIPADVVSGLGDGSTDQGVRRLHEMMNKVRQQRTGKKAQPKAIGGKIAL